MCTDLISVRSLFFKEFNPFSAAFRSGSTDCRSSSASCMEGKGDKQMHGWHIMSWLTPGESVSHSLSLCFHVHVKIACINSAKVKAIYNDNSVAMRITLQRSTTKIRVYVRSGTSCLQWPPLGRWLNDYRGTHPCQWSHPLCFLGYVHTLLEHWGPQSVHFLLLSSKLLQQQLNFLQQEMCNNPLNSVHSIPLPSQGLEAEAAEVRISFGVPSRPHQSDDSRPAQDGF